MAEADNRERTKGPAAPADDSASSGLTIENVTDKQRNLRRGEAVVSDGTARFPQIDDSALSWIPPEKSGNTAETGRAIPEQQSDFAPESGSGNPAGNQESTVTPQNPVPGAGRTVIPERESLSGVQSRRARMGQKRQTDDTAAPYAGENTPAGTSKRQSSGKRKKASERSRASSAGNRKKAQNSGREIRRRKKKIRPAAVIMNHLSIILPVILLIAIIITTAAAVSARRRAAAAEAAAESTASTGVEMKLNAYEDLNTLINRYFDAYAEGDTQTLSEITKGLDEEDYLRIEEISKYIDYYTTIDVYSKDGPQPGTYVVYAYTEELLQDYSNAVPGLTTMYVASDENGNLYIDASAQSEEVTNYIQTVTVQEDAIDLNNRVNADYNKLVAEDADFNSYLDSITDSVNISVAQRMAQLTQEREAAEQEQEEPAEEETAEKKYLVAQDIVNIRSEASQDGEILSQTEIGDKFELLESLGSGWSRILYNGSEAYVMTKFFSAENSDGTQAEAGVQVIGTASVKETVRMREQPNTDSNVVNTLYTGAEVEITGTSGDWKAVNYNGQSGYIKSEFLKEN